MSEPQEKYRGIRQKVFITIPWFLPAFRAGGPIRSIANLADHFSEADIWIFTGDTDVTGAALTGIDTGRWTDYNPHTKVWYAEAGQTSHQLTAQAESISPDVIFMIGMYSWHFTIVPLLYCKAPKKILSVRGMLHPGALSKKSLKKKLFLRAFKLFEYPHKIWFHATDDTEKAYIRSRLGEVARVIVAGNIPRQCVCLPVVPKQAGSLRLVTLSLISPMKNILAVLRALQQVRSVVNYEIYGAIRDGDYWEQCREAIRTLPENITVEYKGPVPFTESQDAIADSHVFIMPSESENFGHALYEAMACGRPVITSVDIPWKDLKEQQAGVNVYPHDIEEITGAIEYFSAMDVAVLNEWSSCAASYAAAAIDRDLTLNAYREMFFGGNDGL